MRFGWFLTLALSIGVIAGLTGCPKGDKDKDGTKEAKKEKGQTEKEKKADTEVKKDKGAGTVEPGPGENPPKPKQ